MDEKIRIMQDKQIFFHHIQQQQLRMIDDNEQYSRKVNLIVCKFRIKKKHEGRSN